MNDLDAAPPEWRIGDVRKLTLGVAVGPRQYIADSFEQCMNAFSCVRTRRRNLPSSKRVWNSAASTTNCEYTVTQSFRNSGLQKSMTRLNSGLSNGSFRVSQRTV